MGNQTVCYAIISFEKEKRLKKKIEELNLNYYKETPIYFVDYDGTGQDLAKKLGYNLNWDEKNVGSGIILRVSDCCGWSLKEDLWSWLYARGLALRQKLDTKTSNEGSQ